MSDAIFPVGLVIDDHCSSFDEMKVREKGWDIHSSEIEGGPFSSIIKGIHTPSIQLAHTVYSKAMIISGAFPEQCILLYIAESERPPVVHDLPTLANELSIGFEGGAVDVLINSASKYYTISVGKELFLSEYYRYFGVTLEESTEVEKLLIEEEQLHLFFEGINAWVKYLSNQELKVTYKNRYESIEKEILSFVFSFIITKKKPVKRLKFDIKIVREYLEDSLENDLNVKQLARNLNISERQLHNAFKGNYGVTPKKFLQQLRLNAIKKELLASTTKNTIISDIAFKYKFLHMSHFTSEYKKLFGQTPSSTLEHK